MNKKLLIFSLLTLFYSILALPSFGEMTLQENIRILQNDFLNKSKDNSREIKILEKYSKSIDSLDNRERLFLHEVLSLMKEFIGKPLDIVVETDGDFDGDGKNDTISSRVYETNGKIVVASVWRKNNKTLWKFTIENPYLWIGQSDIFQYDTRDIWVVFTIALNHAVPKAIDPFGDDDVKRIIIEEGVVKLSDYGISTTSNEYSHYIDTFKGKLLQYGEPELGGGVIDIWYSPAERFIPYYRP